jgi:hypothetical protein
MQADGRGVIRAANDRDHLATVALLTQGDHGREQRSSDAMPIYDGSMYIESSTVKR